MSAVFTLPERPNLEHLKAQAKALLTAYRGADPEAIARVRSYFPPTQAIGLNQAQLVIAREYGFESWAKLKRHVDALAAVAPAADLPTRAGALAKTAAWERESAESVLAALAAEPPLATATIAAACISGEAGAVQAFVAAEPGRVNGKIAPLDWEPLLYVCYSSLLRVAEYRPRLLETARVLLAAGADPNAGWIHPEWPDSVETCLYGATGAHNCPALAELLLKSGANPTDNEALYHSTELPEWDCLKLLMEYGGDIQSHNVLGHMLDREEPEWLRMMLSYEKDKKRIPAVIPFALRRGRSTEVLQILIESGMDLNAPDKGQGASTPYQSATRLGRTDVTALLEAAGADMTLSPADVIIGRLARGEAISPTEISRDVIAALDAEKPTPTLTVLAERGHNVALETLLEAGADPNVSDGNGWNGLHHAALAGRISTVRVLLRHGAEVNVRERAHNAPPLGFACYGSANHRAAPAEDYVAVVAALLDAGATRPETAWGSEEVQALLVARGSKPAAA